MHWIMNWVGPADTRGQVCWWQKKNYQLRALLCQRSTDKCVKIRSYNEWLFYKQSFLWRYAATFGFQGDFGLKNVGNNIGPYSFYILLQTVDANDD